MAKKRKTRQQKLQSDKRHTTQRYQTAPIVSPTHQTASPPPATTPAAATVSGPTRHTISTSEYQFVRHDLLKTSTITGAIIVAELVLFFVLR